MHEKLCVRLVIYSGYWYLYCGLYSLGLQSKTMLCVCAYSRDFCRNFVVACKRLNVRLCHRVNVKFMVQNAVFCRNLSPAPFTFF